MSAISEKLQKDLPGLRGFSATSLKKMRLFYENWNELDSISSVATDEINNIIIPTVLNFKLDKDFPIEDFFRVPFTHHSEILSRVKDEKARFYYIHRTAEEHLSVEQLVKLIKENTFEHNYTIPNNFSKTVSNVVMARKAVMMFKDEYLLDFINVEEIDERESIDIDERVVEFKSSYLGQLMSYLSILDVKVKKSHENPSIGIVLCKSANRDYVEFVIQDYNKPMGVATYTTSSEMPEKLRKALPDIEELKKIL